MHAAATDCIAVLERKLPEYAYALGAANEGLYQGPELVVAYQFAAHKGDEYQQTLDYLTSTEAVKTANPDAYAAGELGVKIVDITKTATGFAGAAAYRYGDEFANMMGDNVIKRVRAELGSTILHEGTSQVFNGSLDAAIEQLYALGISE